MVIPNFSKDLSTISIRSLVTRTTEVRNRTVSFGQDVLDLSEVVGGGVGREDTGVGEPGVGWGLDVCLG